ncbi:MAG: plasmid recombination protein [Tannerella sp.]|nr:plasmid recombination protein [Tannerella sp.]
MAKFAVLHLEKRAGNDAPISSHIERTVNPANADKDRTHLNQELIEFPDGVRNRTEAIQYRIEHAKIARKISHNQVRAIRVMMTGSPEQMQCIQDEGKLDDWCRDSLDWLRKEVGNENVVSAVLHLDEQTPHIHATVVPIVTGERRKAKQEQQKAGRKYKKKKINAPRLCADDIMSRERFTHLQNTYAHAMSKFGLVRGKEGSKARHIGTQQYYRELVGKNEDLKEIIQEQEHERQEVYHKTRDLYDRKDEARDKFLNMDRHVRDKQEELATIEIRLQKAKQEYEPYQAQEELNLIHNLFPMMKEQLRIADLCKTMGLAFNSIKALLEGRNLTAKTFSFFSPEHQQKFTAEDVKLKMEKEPDNPDKLRLNLNGMNILDWFREQYQRMKQATRLNIKPKIDRNKGFKM